MNNNDLPAFLLIPWLIPEGKPAISLLKIIKKGKTIDFTTREFKWPLISKEFKSYPAPLKDILMDCCLEAVEKIRENLNQRYEHQKAGIGYDDFFLQGDYHLLA